MAFLDNYEDVAARIARFWATYPSGKIHTHIMDVDVKAGYILIECRVYKEFEDAEPSGIDYAFGNVATYNAGMKKWFVEDTVTSAIGRAVGLVLGAPQRPTAQNMAQVEQIDQSIVQASATDEDLWATFPSYKTASEAEQSGVASLGSSMDEIKTQLGGTMLAAAPRCPHGVMVWKTGEKNGRAWGGYMCTEKVRDRQCKPVFYTLASDGQWKPQV